MAGPTLISSLLLMVYILLPLSCIAQGTCRGRCGEAFSRGQPCTCDTDCLAHNECCKDYEDVCTNRNSCRGRCGETFRRGKECECDPDCTLYNTCCSDFLGHCDSHLRSAAAKSAQANLKQTATPKTKTKKPDVHLKDPAKSAESESEERCRGCAEDLADLTGRSLSPDGEFYPPLLSAKHGASTPGADTSSPMSAAGPSQPGDAASSGKPFSFPIKVSVSISEHADGAPASGDGRRSTLADITEALGTTHPTGQPESSKPDLCDGLPIDGLASLFNGSIIVFRGHFFWLLDPQTRQAGPARSITSELGVPSPIDTVFTRSNCQAKTYIIKNDNYWSFENGVMEPGYPRSVSKDFGGLSGEISAALPVPSSRKRPEVIYFFKKDGTGQKFSYPTGSSPSCSGKKSMNSRSHQTSSGDSPGETHLSGEINIKLNWKGFPTPVTSALTIPNPKKPDGFEYFIFSWPKFFSIRISGDIPTLVAPAKPSSQQNDVRSWMNCPQQA